MGSTTPAVSQPDVPHFTIAVLPDTQYYSERNPAAFERQTRWLADQWDEGAVDFVVHEGDVVDSPKPDQLRRADRAFRHLEEHDVPYLLTIGNHDYDDISSRDADTFEEFFPVSRFEDAPYWEDSYDGTAYNAYGGFEALGNRYLILALEPFPRESVVEWARDVLSSHSYHRALMVTHAYLYNDGTPIDSGDRWDRTVYDVSGHNGDQLWESFISQKSSLLAVFSGHVLCDGTGGTVQMRTDTCGNPVTQVLTNYQDLEDGGRGFLRLVRFFPAADSITIESYSPLLDAYHPDPAHHIRIDGALGNGDEHD